MAAESSLITLGTFDLRVGGRAVASLRTHKTRALVAYVVSNRGRDVGRERLLELFWNDFEPEHGRAGLRTALSTVRKALRDAGAEPDEILVADKSVVRWIGATETDIDRFAELAQSRDPADHAAARELYRGDFLEGNYEEWVVTERERLSGLYESLLAGAVKRSRDVETARVLLARNPFDEAAYATLIENELKESRPAAAMELLERFRSALAEIGSEASPEFESRFASLPELSEAARHEVHVPFVARTTELQHLERAFRERVGTDGFFALIAGEPGIGKTALLMRARERAVGVDRRSIVIRCTAADPRRMGVWRGLYHRATGQTIDAITSGDASSAAARAIVDSFGEPTVLFVDDAHLLRSDSLAAFLRIVQLMRASGQGLVVTSRPEGINTIERLSEIAIDERFQLGPLQLSDIRAAIALAVDEGAFELAETLYERSGGHPLFFAELLQSLVYRDVLRRERGRWRVVRALDQHLELPQSLRASIEARLRAAGDDAAVVACGLALEPSATAEDLAFALEHPEQRVFDAIDRLLGFGLLREAERGTPFEFSHEIVREVAAAMLNSGRRVALHRSFARRFEAGRSYVDEGRVARHLRAAGMTTQAAVAYCNAARAALSRSHFRDALEHCTHGVATLQRTELTVETELLLSRLHRISAQAASNAGDPDGAIASADDAVRTARASGENREIAKALVVRAGVRGALGDASLQFSDALEATALATEAHESKVGARARVEVAVAARRCGAGEEAVRFAREACELARACADPIALYNAYEELLHAQICTWLFEDAAKTFTECASVAETVGMSTQARLCGMRAACEYLMERSQRAADQVSSGLHYAMLSRERGEPSATDLSYPAPLVWFVLYYLRGAIAASRGEWSLVSDAIACCRQAETIVKLPAFANAATMLEIDLLLSMGDVENVKKASDAAQTLSASVASSGIIGMSDSPILIRARIESRLRSPDASVTLRSALDAVEESARRTPLDCDRAFAQLAEAADRVEEAAIRDRALARSWHYRAIRVGAAARAESTRASSGSISVPSECAP
jgi:DNA-binding SARP family transcriptional activator